MKDMLAKFLKRKNHRVLEPDELLASLATQNIPGRLQKLSHKKLREFFDFSRLELSRAYGQRTNFMAVMVCAGLSLMLSRYAYLALLPSDLRQRLRIQASKQFETEVVLTPPRAEIVDRNGRPLAISVLKQSIFIVPKRIPKEHSVQVAVARQLGVPLSQIEDLSKTRKGFSWVKRRLEPPEFQKIGDLAKWKDFVGVIEEPRRIYPEKELAAHLIGFVGLDNSGLEGVEAIFNQDLNGDATNAKVMRDARGRLTLITPNGAVKPEPTSEPLKLSIDLSIQYFAESALREAAEKARARGASVVVMDIETGEILAMASYPTYDLNNPPENDPNRRRFRPVMDALELGSVVKPIFISQALDRGVIKPTEQIFCENGKMAVPGGKIGDTHPHGFLTPSEIIKYSSNIGTYKVVQRMGRNIFYETVIRAGLGRYPGTGLPGEWAGRISLPHTWREMRFANMAFGQGLAISPLQLTRAISIITGGGKDVSPSLLKKEPEQLGSEGPRLQYISPATSKIITQMMSTVVEEEGGTGRLAAIPGVSVAGKTGTAQKFSQVTKSYSERTASFVGVIPAEKPKLAIAVVVDEPQVRPAYGGSLAGPAFASIGTKTIRYLNALGQLAFDTTSEKSQNKVAQKNGVRR